MIYRFLIVFFICINSIAGQNQSTTQIDDCKMDTVLIINHSKLCNTTNYMDRSKFLESDSIGVNHAGLEVYSYNVSSFTLENRLNLKIQSAIITDELKKNIASLHSNYKYITIDKVVLKNKQNNYYSTTLNSLKIIFLD